MSSVKSCCSIVRSFECQVVLQYSAQCRVSSCVAVECAVSSVKLCCSIVRSVECQVVLQYSTQCRVPSVLVDQCCMQVVVKSYSGLIM